MMNDQKNAIVTGACGAIGKAIATGVAGNGFRVILVGRDRPRLEKTRDSIMKETANAEVSFGVIDLAIREEIIDFSRQWKGPLHLLINNAATGPRKRTETPQGIEVQWATNVMGYFWMMKYFSPFMKGPGDARIVNVASYWAGGLDLDDPEFKSRRYDNDAAYRQAKQADRMLSVAFARKLGSMGITVNACHPGDVNSKLSNSFGFGGSESPEQGAATPLFLALSGQMRGVTGKYYEHLKQVSCPFSADRQAVERLFDVCDREF